MRTNSGARICASRHRNIEPGDDDSLSTREARLPLVCTSPIMEDNVSRPDTGELQFDRVLGPGTETPAREGIVCSHCDASVASEYYQINGLVFCGPCRNRIEAAAETPRGVGPLSRSGLFGLGAGIAGAAIYFAVLAVAHLEIGIVAILIGYMVGYGVRTGARGRGGLRFQVMAAVLTYLSVAFAYGPLVIKQAMDADAQKPHVSAAAPAPVRTSTSPRADRPAVGGRFLVGLASLLGFVSILPVLIVVGSLPSGLITAVIIGVGMRQAWRMTAAPRLDVYGPYRVGAPSA